MSDILELIKTRRSIRRYKEGDIPEEAIEKILDAGRWAPSGLNNQPWRFVAIKDKKQKEGLAGFTKYKEVVKNSNVAICVFLDKDSSYNTEKDILALGACAQNMLLASHSLGVGGCWLGEILNQKEDVRKFLKLGKAYELFVVLALGYPNESPKSPRTALNKLIIS